ncbi:MAG: dihydroneopterin aldolase [Deltaproteobacteria bacterium]|nr:MAG: dihydroneopterin aldolase [Deltaproteobacteria bacterium]
MTRDTILVHNLEFVGHHGVYDEERHEGRRFAVDIAAHVETRGAGSSDRLGDTVDYRDLARIVLEVADGPSRHLIETLAEESCTRILDELPSVRQVELTIRKYATGVPGDPDWVGLRILRCRDADHDGG